MTYVSVVYRFIVRLTVFLFNVLMLLAIIYGDFLLLKKKQIKWRNSKEKDNFIIRYLWNIQIFQNKICSIWFRNNRFLKIIFIYLDFFFYEIQFLSSFEGGGGVLFLFCSLPFQSLTLYNIYYVNSSSQNISRTSLHC